MKKLLALLLAAVSFAGFTACNPVSKKDSGGNSAENPDNISYDIDPETEATLKITIQSYDNEEKIIKAVADEFNKDFPNVKINIDRMSGELSTTLMSYYNAEKSNPGTMPDIWFTTSFDMFALSKAQITLNMDPYLTAAKDAGLFDESDYVAQYWTLGKNNFKDEQYMIPRSADRVVTHYNKDIIGAAEKWCKEQGYTDKDFPEDEYTEGYIKDESAPVELLSRIKNGWTWQDMLYVCYWCRLYFDQNNMSSLYLVDSYFDWEANYNPIFEAMGVEYFDDAGNVALNSSKTENALKLMKYMYDKKYVAPVGASNQANFAGGEGIMLFHSQSISITENSLSALSKYKGRKMSEVFDVCTFPLINYNQAPKIGCGIAGYSIFNESRNKELSVLFLLKLISAEGQTALANNGINYPSIRVDMQNKDAPWAKEYSEEGFNTEAYTYGQEYCCGTTFVAAKDPKYATDIMSCISTMIEGYCGGKTFAKVIEDCEADIEYYLMF